MGNKIWVTCSLEGCNNKKLVTPWRVENSKTIFCCREHYIEHRKSNYEVYAKSSNPNSRIAYICQAEGCNNTKTVWRSEYNKNKNHFCGLKCAGRYKRGMAAVLPKEIIICDVKIDNSKEARRKRFKEKWDNLKWEGSYEQDIRKSS